MSAKTTAIGDEKNENDFHSFNLGNFMNGRHTTEKGDHSNIKPFKIKKHTAPGGG